MKRSENVYANSVDSVDSYEDVYANEDSLETRPTRSHKGTMTSGETAWSRCYTLSAVCVLLLLCVLLLIAVIVLGIKYNNLNTENNQRKTRHDNLTTEREQIQGDHFQQQNIQLLSVMSKLGCRVFKSSVYCISTEKKNWNASREDCRRKGADLVVINSKEEQEFLSKYFDSTEAWIGLTDTETEGDFKWVDDTPLTTEFWWVGEPNDFGVGEDCGVTGYKSTNMSTWADYNCDHPIAGICELKLTDIETS